jgi:hypothetical protein
MSKKAEFSAGATGRRPHRNADDRLPVKNMTDWGCTDTRIKEPRYSDRAYELCCPVGMEEYSKISGQIQNVRTPRMLAKQRYSKDDFQTQDRIQAAPAELSAPLKGPKTAAPNRPFFNGRKKKR